jgi:hypothetical protein
MRFSLSVFFAACYISYNYIISKILEKVKRISKILEISAFYTEMWCDRMLKPEEIAHKIEKIIESKGMSNRKFLAEHGLKPNTIDAMKRGSMPAADETVYI